MQVRKRTWWRSRRALGAVGACGATGSHGAEVGNGDGGWRTETRRIPGSRCRVSVVVLVLWRENREPSRLLRTAGPRGAEDSGLQREEARRRVVVGGRRMHGGEVGAGLRWVRRVDETPGGGRLMVLHAGVGSRGQGDVQRGCRVHYRATVHVEWLRQARRARGLEGGRRERQRCGEWLAHRRQSFHSKHSVSVRNQLPMGRCS